MSMAGGKPGDPSLGLNGANKAPNKRQITGGDNLHVRHINKMD